MRNNEQARKGDGIEYIFTSYVNKTIQFAKMNFERRNKKYSQHEVLSLNDVDFLEEENIEKLEDEDKIDESFDMDVDSLENAFVDEKMYRITRKLTIKQKQVLYLKYVEDMTESRIANTLKITRQAVNKIKIAVIKHIAHEYSKG